MKVFFLVTACFCLLLGCASSPSVDSGTYTYPKETVTINQNSADKPAPAATDGLQAANQSGRESAQKANRVQRTIRPKTQSENRREKAVEKDLLPPSRAVLSENIDNETKEMPAEKQAVLLDEDDDIAALLNDTNVQNFDIPIVFNDAVKYYITFFTTEKRKVFSNWLRRSKRYVPMITEILRKNNLPEDLVYLAMIESGFNPKAYSTAKACGPWQFIYETGGRYGLKVNYWVDERRDPEKSTVAAAKYLGDLFDQFGHWYLAAAGYNAGENRVERAIAKHNTNDFWELYKYNALPKETRNYIPQLIAAAIIAKEPEKYGFGNIVYEQALRFTEAKVPPATSLSVIAKASGHDLDTLKSYNPELIRGITPPGSYHYEIKLPRNTDKERFIERLEAALDSERQVKSVVQYKVKKKDTLARITKKFHIKMEDLYLVNSCEEGLNIKPGAVIAIPKFTGPSKTMTAKNSDEEKPRRSSKSDEAKNEDNAKNTEKTSKTVKVAKKDETGTEEKTRKIDKKGKNEKEPEQDSKKTYHLVKKGDTLSSISDKYGIDVAELKSINNLKDGKVKLNTKLRLVSHTEKKHSPKAKYHVVKKGETLATISEKYGVDVGDIKAANRLKGNKIQAKMKLKIPAEG